MPLRPTWRVRRRHAGALRIVVFRCGARL